MGRVHFHQDGVTMADVDGNVTSMEFESQSAENASGAAFQMLFASQGTEDSSITTVFNTTVAGGGGATIVRQNPELVRTTP